REVRVAGHPSFTLVAVDELADEGEVASVPAPESDLADPHPLEPFDRGGDEFAVGIRRYRDRTGEGEMMGGEPAADDGHRHDLLREALRDVTCRALGEERVGRERQVWAVLLERGERDEPDRSVLAELLGLGPGQVLQLD